MSTQLLMMIIVMWAALAIAGIVGMAYLICRIHELELLTKDQLKKLEDKLQWFEPAEEIALPDLTPEQMREYEEMFRNEMVDDKTIVCRKLGELLQLTRAGEDVKSIEYRKIDDADGAKYEEYAVIRYNDGYSREVTITGDSGKAVIADVLKAV